jgi:exopolyphosphatase/guanosine-5'-triphosphate,3'-diphosphate pyrophosphatase
MPVAVVDIGSNSTRLLIAEVDEGGGVHELVRHSHVTRLGAGVDADGSLSEEAMGRVFDTLQRYREEMDAHDVHVNLAVLTSAVRDAANGEQFTQQVRRGFELDARVLAGDEEAQLTFLGATSGRRASRPEPMAVIDIGGGSTEFIVGVGGRATFHSSTQAGVVRMSERHLHSDPPQPAELQSLADDVREVFATALPDDPRARARAAVAVAGTATSGAAMAQELEPYDPQRVEGYRLDLGTVEMLLARLAEMTESQRRQVAGLHPDRAPTIVAGMILLGEAMRAFGLEEAEVSEQDILRGGALRLAGRG